MRSEQMSSRETFAYVYASWAALLAVSGRVQHEFSNDTILMFVENFWSYSTDDIFGAPITNYGIGDMGTERCVESDLKLTSQKMMPSEVLFNRAVWCLVRFIENSINNYPYLTFEEKTFISNLYESLFAATKDRESRVWIKNIYQDAFLEALNER